MWDLIVSVPDHCLSFYFVHVTSSRAPFNTKYILHGQVLEAVTSARYSGVDISINLNWNTHVNTIA